jgi:hypothetical protein
LVRNVDELLVCNQLPTIAEWLLIVLSRPATMLLTASSGGSTA